MCSHLFSLTCWEGGKGAPTGGRNRGAQQSLQPLPPHSPVPPTVALTNPEEIPGVGWLPAWIFLCCFCLKNYFWCW